MGEWKPIETAPKDGALVVLCRFIRDDDGFRYIGLGRWSKMAHGFIEPGAPSDTYYRPTHWQLPEPPQ